MDTLDKAMAGMMIIIFWVSVIGIPAMLLVKWAEWSNAQDAKKKKKQEEKKRLRDESRMKEREEFLLLKNHIENDL